MAQPTERRNFILGVSWTFTTLEPGEVLWDTGAQEGLAGKRQLDRWSKLLAEHVLQVEWSREKPESASGIGGVTQPIGIVFVPVGLAGCNGIIRFTVVEQDDLLPVGIIRTLRASLDLIDGRDKVIFRQFGEESSLRTVQSGHTTIRADLFDPDGWQLPETTELCPDNDEGFTTNYMSVIAHVHQTTRGMDDDTPAGIHTPASTHGCRPQQKTTPSVDGPTRFQTTNQPMTSLLSKSGEPMHGVFQNHERDIWTSSPCPSPGETQRHGTLSAVKQRKRLAHHMVYVRCAAFFDTLSREFLMLVFTGRSEGLEQREMKNKKSNVANFLEVQSVRGKALPRGNR